MKKVITILIIVFAFSYCTKGPNGNGIVFSGITKTDQAGFPLSNDSTDWRLNDIWVKQESDLFTSNHPSNCTPFSNYRIIAFPNPCTEMFSLEILQSNPSRVEMRIIDKNFRVLYSNDTLTAVGMQVNTRSLGVKGLIRVYYKFIENDCEFKGHGDIMIQ